MRQRYTKNDFSNQIYVMCNITGPKVRVLVRVGTYTKMSLSKVGTDMAVIQYPTDPPASIGLEANHS